MFTLKYFVASSATIVGVSSQFYTFGILNSLNPQLFQWLQQVYGNRFGWESTSFKFDLFWAASVSFLALGAIPGLLIADLLASKFGPRSSLIASGILSLIAHLLQLCIKLIALPELLLVSRLILGFTMTLSFGLMTLYLADITPPKIRQQLDKAIQSLAMFSLVLAFFAGLPEINHGYCRCPESPKFLYLSCGKREEAQQVLNQLFDKKQATSMFVLLLKENSQTKEQEIKLPKMSLRFDFQSKFSVALLLTLAQLLTGVSVVLSYSTFMIEQHKVNETVKETKASNAQLGTSIIGLAYFSGASLSRQFVGLLGQKPAILFQFIIVSIALFACSAALWFYDTNKIDQNFGAIFALVFYALVYGLGSPMPWPIGPRTVDFNCPLVTKFFATISWIFVFVLTASFLPIQQLVPRFCSLLPFAIASSLFAVVFFFIVPENWASNSQPWHNRRQI